MSIGSQIRKYREQAGLTQEALAEALHVSGATISYWENDHNEPSLQAIGAMTKLFGITASDLIDESESGKWITANRIFNEDRMYTYVRTMAKSKGLTQTLWALDFAREAHAGQVRDALTGAPTPYINHPLTMACHALAMELYEDDLLAAVLLHDVVEDCGKKPEELQVSDAARRAVELVTKDPHPADKEAAKAKYYERILADPLACMVKCLDRCNNVSCMATGFTKEKIREYVRTTEKYFPLLHRVIKNVPKWNNAAWLLQYQMGSLLETYKRLV